MSQWSLGFFEIIRMEWFTLEWLMKNLEWAVGLLAIGCIILFFFPVLLGWQLRQDAKKEQIK
jgi:peptidoglycan biosynthesis protein MviN/MurJ (putative lipid II flippase)